jgi:SAM-dependent methyltransferase
VGALVLVDTLHHLPRPLQFVTEAARVLKHGGRVAMVEPWITPASWVLYRFLHHEECRMGADLARPFGAGPKAPLDGNAAIPWLLVRRLERESATLQVRLREPFVGLPYLATLGFKVARPLPSLVAALARTAEQVVRPLAGVLATRILLVLEKHA